MAENKVVVHIYGEDYPITGVTDPSHISKVADFVDSRMKDAAKHSRVKARDKVAILSLMSIASELLDKSEELNWAAGQMDSELDAMIARLDEALPAESGP